MSLTQPDYRSMSAAELASLAETALGENLIWLSDALDQRVRQQDAECLQRLAQLNKGWIALCHLKKRIESQRAAQS